MAYNEFAYFYDEFNGEADYDALYAISTRSWMLTGSVTASSPTSAVGQGS